MVLLPKKYTDKEMKQKIKNTFLIRDQIDTIYTEDVDVYDKESGRLLLMFRKGALSEANGKAFYDNIIHFMRTRPTSARGNTTGNYWEPGMGAKVKSNIIGYFDKLSNGQNRMLKDHGIKLETNARKTLFTIEYPEKYQRMLPYVQEIDQLFRQNLPHFHQKQWEKAEETCYRIEGTAFSTVTVNLNYRTTVHRDKKDDPDGFGNLTVIERGQYRGGEICLPQWGVGVDVRQGDMLFMDVRQWHGNLPLEYLTKDAERLSTVCYFIPNLWRLTRHLPQEVMDRSMKTLRDVRADVRNGGNVYDIKSPRKTKTTHRNVVEEA